MATQHHARSVGPRKTPADTAARQYAKFRKQPAQLTVEEARHLYEKSLAYDAQRPVLLASLAKSGAELIAATKAADAEGAEVIASATLQAGEYAQKLRELANFMGTASLRLLAALCEREDAENLLRDARARCSTATVAKARS